MKERLDANHIQRTASTPDASVYLAAAAGTGKTKVLTDRYLRLMLAGFPPSKILCITFTNAAAAEMLVRIESRLLEWQQCSDEQLHQSLLQLMGNTADISLMQTARNQYNCFLAEYDQLKIQTLHSFCFDLLKKFAPHSNRSIIGEIIPTTQLQKFAHQALEQLFEQKEDLELQSNLEVLIAFYDSNRLLSLILELLSDKIRFKSYINNISNLKEDVWKRYYAVDALEVSTLINTHYPHDKLEKLKKMADILHYEQPELSAQLSQFCESPIDRWEQYQQVFLTTKFTVRKKILKASAQKKFPFLAEFIEHEAVEVQSLRLKIISLRNARNCYALLFVAKRFIENMENLKAAEQLLEYDDIILSTIAMLADEEFSHAILYKLDAAIEHVLVDEAQDLSVSQWQVIKLLTEEFFAGLGTKDFNRTIFIVGDFKQSIYSFQGANPQYFNQIKFYFRDKVQAAQMKWHELDMQISFRTTPPILNLVNAFFTHSQHNFGIAESIQHVAHRTQGGGVAIWEASQPSAANENIEWQMPQSTLSEDNHKQLNAYNIAAQIAHWVSKGRYLLGHNRVIVASDIMILVRKRGELVQYLLEELSKHNIPVADTTTSNIKDYIIIKDLLAMISFICFPYDDYNLACLLKSPFFKCTEQHLFELAHQRENTLFNSIKVKDQQLYLALENLIKDVGQLKLSEWLYKILIESKINLADAALQYFLESVLVFEAEAASITPLLFLPWFDEYAQNHKFLADQQEKVRIMTIHSSKGLQAPVVILADAASSEQSPHQNIFWHDNLPFFSTYTEEDCELLKRVKQQHYQDIEEENLRLLYVAITRAEDELYIAGWHNNKLQYSWYSKLRNFIEDEKIEYTFGESLATSSSFNTVVDINASKSLKPAKTISPSTTEHNNEVEASVFKRGLLIHKTLYELPKLPPSKWEQYFQSLVQNAYAKIPEAIGWYQEAIAVLERHPQLFFGEGVIAELPVSYHHDGYIINAQIDLLNVSEQEVHIIEIKTNRDPQQFMEQYKQQLKYYKTIMQTKYPAHNIATSILYTYTNQLVKLDVDT